MNIFTDNKSQESVNDFNLGSASRKLSLQGIFYAALAAAGLVFSVVLLWHNMGEMIPEYGIVMTSILGGTISQFILVYGYSGIRRNM